MERLARDKHSSFLRKLVNYGRKKFNNIDTRNKNLVLLKINAAAL
jgi:hypothetical protein